MKQKFFTLVELIAVIFIVVLLMGIMIQGVGLVRGRSELVSCQNTLGELAKTAIDLSSAQSHNGNFPGPARGRAKQYQWDYTLASTLNLAICQYDDDSTATAEANKLFTCPRDPYLREDEAMRSFCLNLGNNEINPKLSQIDSQNIRTPGDTVMFFEYAKPKSKLFSQEGNYAATVSAFAKDIAKKDAPAFHGREGEPKFCASVYDGSAIVIEKTMDVDFEKSSEYRLFFYDKRR